MTQHRTLSRSKSHADSLARGLGWFSIGLGLVEVMAPHRLTRAFGLRGQERVIQAYGWREIATGIGILAAKDPSPWIWGRIGGDALDLATLATGLNDRNHRKENLGLAMASVAGVTALDVYCATALAAANRAKPKARPLQDYSRRSGMPRSPDAMRGAASDFVTPADMREGYPTTPRDPVRPGAMSRA
jgi:hypothetical protein